MDILYDLLNYILKLHDFSLIPDGDPSDNQARPIICTRYGEVSEPSLIRPVSICRHGGDRVEDRVQHVYLSQTNMIHITLPIESAVHEDKRFMIMYQGKQRTVYMCIVLTIGVVHTWTYIITI